MILKIIPHNNRSSIPMHPNRKQTKEMSGAKRSPYLCGEHPFLPIHNFPPFKDFQYADIQEEKGYSKASAFLPFPIP